jgi:hypothetical protein
MKHSQLFSTSITALFLSLVMVANTATPVSAANLTATISAKVAGTSATVSAQTTAAEEATLQETTGNAIEEIKKRIEKNASKVKGVINDALSVPYGVIGEVQRINEDALTFKNQQGTTILAINEAEVVIERKNKKTALTDIAVGEWVTVLGYKNAEEFTPRHITVSETSLRPRTQVVILGAIEKTTTKEIILRDRATGESRTFSVLKTSTFEDANGEKAVVSDFETDVTVLAVGFDGENGYELATLRSLVPLSEE